MYFKVKNRLVGFAIKNIRTFQKYCYLYVKFVITLKLPIAFT